MKTIVVLAIVAILAIGCVNPFGVDPDSTLTIRVGAGGPARWPDDTTFVAVNGKLDDPRGLAGLEVTVTGDDMPTRMYNASHFADGDVRFRVPDTGFATIVARIVQDGRIVAEVTGRWGFGPKIQWDIDVERAPYPPNEGFPQDLDHPTRCQWFWCAFKWRDLIDTNAANYDGEALWVVLYRHDPDECVDDCRWP
ncbi:MAG: hypothetical protein OXE96_00005 [Gemmatimonadetes bacterium]|nr:hypothetical protein [Gemmatimonadota bacterium]